MYCAVGWRGSTPSVARRPRSPDGRPGSRVFTRFATRRGLLMPTRPRRWHHALPGRCPLSSVPTRPPGCCRDRAEASAGPVALDRAVLLAALRHRSSRGEKVGLDLADVDLSGHLVTRQWVKGQSSGRFPFGPRGRGPRWMRTWRAGARQGEQQLCALPRARGGRLDVRIVRSLVHLGWHVWTAPRTRPHGIRTYRKTYLLEGGADLAVYWSSFGHVSLATTPDLHPGVCGSTARGVSPSPSTGLTRPAQALRPTTTRLHRQQPRYSAQQRQRIQKAGAPEQSPVEAGSRRAVSSASRVPIC